jgi:CheY-like chemotaxis protein
MRALTALEALVVDDQPIIDEFCRKVLLQLGCKQVFTAHSGREALQILAHRPGIDMILTDIDMQPGNGLELLQAIRCGDIPGLPRDRCVLMFTDHSYRNNVMSAVGLDCNDFISKPLNAALLRDKIDAALRRKITPADAAVYRAIPTDVETATGLVSPGAADLAPTATAEPAPSPAGPPARAEAPPETDGEAVVAEDDSANFRQALAELAPSHGNDRFVRQKQQQLTEILRQLDAIRREIRFGSLEQAAEMTSDLEQVSAELFGQEYQHQREHQFNHLALHQAEHGMILQRTQMLTNKIRQQKRSRALVAHQQLLQTWYRHVAGKDQQYVRYLAAQEGQG